MVPPNGAETKPGRLPADLNYDARALGVNAAAFLESSMKSAIYNDLSLHYRLVVPGGGEDSASLPLVLALHGRGSDSNDLAELAPMIDGGYRFIFPDAPFAFEPTPGIRYGFSWFDGWPARKNSIAGARELLLAFITELIARYPTPAGQIVLIGFSQGGMMSLDVGFRVEPPIAGVAVMSGALFEDDMPDFALGPQMPVLIVHGTDDDVIPVSAARRTRRVLEDSGLDPDYEEFPMGHQVSQESMRRVAGFLRKCLVR
jgi:phospholipase/carboxylesterase